MPFIRWLFAGRTQDISQVQRWLGLDGLGVFGIPGLYHENRTYWLSIRWSSSIGIQCNLDTHGSPTQPILCNLRDGFVWADASTDIAHGPVWTLKCFDLCWLSIRSKIISKNERINVDYINTHFCWDGLKAPTTWQTVKILMLKWAMISIIIVGRWFVTYSSKPPCTLSYSAVRVTMQY